MKIARKHIIQAIERADDKLYNSNFKKYTIHVKPLDRGKILNDISCGWTITVQWKIEYDRKA